jgi:hypothetical protein
VIFVDINVLICNAVSDFYSIIGVLALVVSGVNIAYFLDFFFKVAF